MQAVGTPSGRPQSVVRVAESGFLAQRFQALASRAFDVADYNKDGSVDATEAYMVVLQLYVQINRHAPVNPPPRGLVLKLFAAADKEKTGKLSRDEFSSLASVLCARAVIRIVLHKVMTLLGGPLCASWLVLKLPGRSSVTTLFARIIPVRFHAVMLTQGFARILLTVGFCVSLGNIACKILDSFLGYHAKYEDLVCHEDAPKVEKDAKESVELGVGLETVR